MVKTKLIAEVALLAGLSVAAQTLTAQTATDRTDAKEFSWRRVAMDGSRRTDPSRVEASPTARRMASFLESFQPQMVDLHRVVGFCPEGMQKGGHDSPLCNWFCDVMLDESGSLAGRSCDVVILNRGGIRCDMPKGDVTVEDMRSMFPFKNYLTFVQLSGERLLEIFSEMAPRAWEAVGGVRIVADTVKVLSVEVGGKPLEQSQTYTLVTNDFLLHGGDHLYLGEKVISCDITSYDMFDVVMSYLRRLQDKGQPITSVSDGRIKIVGRTHRLPRYDAKVDSENSTSKSISDSRLTILHTNDTHSHIDPIRGGKQDGWGGVIERSIYVDSVRLADGRRNVLLLDAGDFEQGSPYFTLFGGKTEIGSMNIMGYDAATMGNHEWDNGSADLGQRLRKGRFRKLLCNYDVADKGLNRQLKPYTILHRGGVKIGLVGVLADITTLVGKESTGGLVFHNPASCVEKWATFLKDKKKCDLVIVLSHYGFGGHSDDPGDLEMAAKIRNVDIIIGGHTHTNLKAPVYVNDLDGKPVMIVTAWCWGNYVGEIKY